MSFTRDEAEQVISDLLDSTEIILNQVNLIAQEHEISLHVNLEKGTPDWENSTDWQSSDC